MSKMSVIFDMDGVIIKNSEYHRSAWNKFCEKYGISLTEDERKNYLYGTINKTALEYMFKKSLSKEETKRYSDEKEEIYRALYKPNIKLTDNLKEFLELLKRNHIITAIATSADKTNVDFIMESTEIREYFKEIVDADQIQRGKPDPEIYLKAAERINKKPTECIVIEDSISGVKSGKNANMKVMAITNTHSADELREADLIIDNFNELTIEKIEQLL